MRCWIQTPDLHHNIRTGSDPKERFDGALEWQVGRNDIVGQRQHVSLSMQVVGVTGC